MNREDIHITNLEEIVKDYLNEKEIEYIFQYSTRTGFVIDFAIPNKKIAVGVDGEKWHNTKRAKKHDNFKDYMLKREGWNIIRIREEEINNLNGLFSSIL